MKVGGSRCVCENIVVRIPTYVREGGIVVHVKIQE